MSSTPALLRSSAFENVRKACKYVAGFSFVINLLLLVSPIYMLQLYDRVLSSGSVETLLVLTGIALFLLALLAILDAVRSRIMVAAGAGLDHDLKADVFSGLIMQTAAREKVGSQGLRDLDSVRQFLSSSALFAFFDAPWTPLFLFIVALIHPLLGAIALVGVIVIFGLAVATEVVSRDSLKEAGGLAIQSQVFLETSLRNHDVLRAMNVAEGLKGEWAQKRDPAIALQSDASEKVGVLLSVTKAFRFAVQILILGCGGWLALNQSISAGAIVAASIITGRALAPVEQAIGAWRQTVGARAAYRRLVELLSRAEAEKQSTMPLHGLSGKVSVKNLLGSPPGVTSPVLKGISFDVSEGEIVGVIGPSGAGKSLLARHLIGTQAPLRGDALLGGTKVSGLSDADRGRYIGYLPQDVELFPGTIVQNISRFSQGSPEKVVAAAKMAGCQELILGLPQNYETPVGPGGMWLSGGQSQRIALARALYDDPILVVLDEPNSNLDTDGELALVRCLNELRAKRTTTFIITHNIRLLQSADKVLVIKDGAVQAFGPKDEVLRNFLKPARSLTQSGTSV